MLIETKAQFNLLATHFNEAVSDYYPKSIRASKIREMLAKAIGFKSHNGLLSSLPIAIARWTEAEALRKLDSLMADHDGIHVPVGELMNYAVIQVGGLTARRPDARKSLSIEDYAFCKADVDGKTIICLTPLGRKVYEAAEDIQESIPVVSSDNLARLRQAFTHLIDRHPTNPWPKAMYCYAVAPSLWQTNWSENLSHHPEMGFMADAEEGFREFAGVYAVELLPMVKEAIGQFEAWLGASAKNVAPHNLITDDSDTFCWPALLYIGGMIALNCGEDRLAKRWLGLNYKLVANDKFGARYGLSVLRLNHGKGSVQSLFPKDSACAWGWLARALDAFVRGNADKAVQHFLMALKHNYGVCEAFGQPFRGRMQIRIMSNYAAPAFIQEFMFRTRPFWKAHPEARRYFGSICRDPYVQVRVEDYHVHLSAGIGSAFKTAEFRIEHDKRSVELWEAVKDSVVSAARSVGP